jgi:hypothetical protein
VQGRRYEDGQQENLNVGFMRIDVCSDGAGSSRGIIGVSAVILDSKTKVILDIFAVL